MNDDYTVRLAINIGPETHAALMVIASRENITITEAVRRLVTYGELLYRAAIIDKKKVYLEGEFGRENVFLERG